jgi:hypothetical protein
MNVCREKQQNKMKKVSERTAGCGDFMIGLLEVSSM